MFQASKIKKPPFRKTEKERESKTQGRAFVLVLTKSSVEFF